MADTQRTTAQLQSIFAGNNAGLITAQQLRDFIVSTYNKLDDNVVRQNTCCLTLSENISINGDIVLDATEGYGIVTLSGSGGTTITLDGSDGTITSTKVTTSTLEVPHISGGTACEIGEGGTIVLHDGDDLTVTIGTNPEPSIGVPVLTIDKGLHVATKVQVGGGVNGEITVLDNSTENPTIITGGQIVTKTILVVDSSFETTINADGNTGTVTATAFVGDGSGLTGLPSNDYPGVTTDSADGLIVTGGILCNDSITADGEVAAPNVVVGGSQFSSDGSLAIKDQTGSTTINIDGAGGTITCGNESGDDGAFYVYRGNSSVLSVGDDVGVGNNLAVSGGLTVTGLTECGILEASNIEAAGQVIAPIFSTGELTVTGAGVFMASLPTSDPSVAGQLWNDSGTLKVSAGV